MENEILNLINQVETEKANIDTSYNIKGDAQLSEAQLQLIELVGTHPEEFAKAGSIYYEKNKHHITYSDEELLEEQDVARKKCLEALDSELCYEENGVWKNDLKNQKIYPNRIYTVESLLDLQAVVVEAKTNGVKVKFMGNGHSYSTIMQAGKEDYIILPVGIDNVLYGSEEFALLGNNQALLENPSEKNLMETEAGIPISKLNVKLKDLKKALKTMGAYSAQTILGVISTSTHGSRHDYGPIPDMVKSILMVARAGDLLRIEPTNGITNKERYAAKCKAENQSITLIQDDKTFYSALVNMGAMGIIYSVVIEVDDAHLLQESRKVSRLNEELVELKKDYKTYMSKDRTIDYNLLVNPYHMGARHKDNHKCVVTRRMKTDKTEPENPSEEKRSFWLVLAASCQMISNMSADCLTGAKNWWKVRDLLNSALNAMNDPNYYVASSEQVYLTPRPKGIKGLAMEMTFPIQYLQEALPRALAILKDLGENKKQFLTAPISVRFVKQSKAYLSQFTAYGEGTKDANTELFFCMEFPMIDGTWKQLQTLNTLQAQMCKDFGTSCRIHWGLNFGMTENNYSLEGRYPKKKEWLEVYADLNEAGVFSNEFTKGMGFDKVLKKSSDTDKPDDILA